MLVVGFDELEAAELAVETARLCSATAPCFRAWICGLLGGRRRRPWPRVRRNMGRVTFILRRAEIIILTLH